MNEEPEDKHVVIGRDGKVTPEYANGEMLRVPKTPEEISAAKTYLRETFAHAVENLEAYLKTPEEMRMQKMTEDLLKSGGTSAEQIEADRREVKRMVAEAAREITEGTQRGDAILDRVIECWQAAGYLPPYLRKSFKP